MNGNNIQKENNIILFTYFFMNGAFIDTLEYYLCAKFYSDNVKLIIVSFNENIYNIKKTIDNVINDRYNNINLKFIEDIIYINKDRLKIYKVNKLLVLDAGTIRYIPHFFFNELIFLIDPFEISTYLPIYNKYIKSLKVTNNLIHNVLLILL
jgi:hypothetical protein